MKETNLINLVTELQNGDQSVFEEIYNQTQHKLYVYAFSIMKNENDAKDLLQETYIEIMRSLKNLQSTNKFIPWAKKILFHLGMQKFRKDGSSVILDEKYENMIENLEETDDLNMPEEAYDVNEVKSIIRGIIEELPVAQQLSIIAYYYDDMNIKDIAEMMECSENTTKTRLHYARISIKEKLESYEKKHNIRLHALSPLLLLSMVGYDEVYAMSADSTKLVATKIAEQVDNWDSLTTSALTTTAKNAVTGAIAKTVGGVAISKLIAVIIVVVVAVSSIGIAQTISGPEKTLKKFEKSFNKGDLDGVLDCVDPEAKTLYKGITSLASAAIDIDVDDVLSSMFGLAVGVEHEDKVSLKIVVQDIEKNGDEAYARGYILLYQGKELYDSSFEKFILKKIDGQWYIME